MAARRLTPPGKEDAMKAEPKPAPPGFHYVYTAYITLRNGKRLYASAYGLKAFAILVRD